MLSSEELIAIKESALNSPGTFMKIRAALIEAGIKKDRYGVRVMCYGLLDKGYLKYGDKKNRFIVTKEGKIKADLPDDLEKYSVDNLRRAINEQALMVKRADQYKKALQPLKKLAKRAKKERHVPLLVNDIIEDLTQRGAIYTISD